jgi:hypothetical protein
MPAVRQTTFVCMYACMHACIYACIVRGQVLLSKRYRYEDRCYLVCATGACMRGALTLSSRSQSTHIRGHIY